MAELNATETITADRCCPSEQEATCCEPGAKADCCGHESGCRCAAGSDPAQRTDIREQVRERYAAAAVQVSTTDPGAGCCAPSETFDGGSEVFGAALCPRARGLCDCARPQAEWYASISVTAHLDAP